MIRIERDHVTINYKMMGTGEITLLFVHGSYIDQTYWKEQVEYFSSDYTVVTLDLPAHGKSGKERKHWSLEGFAKDVNAVINELELKNVILIGHSLAGEINLMAATANLKALIGFIGIDNFKNATIPLDKKQVEGIQNSLKADFINANEQYARMMLIPNQSPVHIVDRVVKDYRNAYRPMALETMHEIFNMAEMEKRLLSQLDLKLYLINVDYIPTNEEPLKHYAGSGYEVFHMQGTCHYPMLENPKELNRILKDVILKIENEAKKVPHFTMVGQ